jgi:hypothetical protein
MIRWLLAAAVALVLLPSLRAADKATQAEYDQIAQAGQFTGKVVSIGGSDQSITVRIDTPTLGAAGNVSARERDILRQQEEILRSRSPAERARHMERLLQSASGNGNLKVTTVSKDFDLDALEDVKVRIAQPPQQYDDKGNPKKYTSQELKDLKGPDTKLPGYTSEFGDLKIGQTVTVYLTTKKPETKKADDKDNNKDKKNNDKKPEMKKPFVKMIVILKDAPDTAGPDRKKGK